MTSWQDTYKQMIQKYTESNKSIFLVLIGGCSRTGKTYLTEKLRSELKRYKINSIVIKLDNWLLGINERSGKETVRERFNYFEIRDSIKRIMKGEKIFSPIYDPKTRLVARENRSQFTQIKDGICFVDGVVALDIPELRTISDFKIYTQLNDELRKERLMEFYCTYKKCSPIESKEIIESRELEEVPIIKQTRRYADIIYHPEN
ncbi:MAG: hypothetical protein ACXAB2_03260 [Candidatus Hodarchaeales archaeon]